MATLTSQILDISDTSTTTLRQSANNDNLIVGDTRNINGELAVISGKVDALTSNTNNLYVTVSAIVVDVNAVKSTLNSDAYKAFPNAATGIIVKNSSSNAVSRTIIGPANGITITNGNGINGNPTISLSNDLNALENLSGSGFAVRTSADAWAQRSFVQPTSGITITNADGIAGNPTITLANDLNALENLSGSGFAVRTANDTWAQRTLVAPSAGITITNSNGISGNPTFALTNDLQAIEGLSGFGIAVRNAGDTWILRNIEAMGAVSITNANGVGGNPTIAVSVASNTEVVARTVTNKVLTPANVDKLVLRDGDTLNGGFTATVVDDGTLSAGANYIPTPVGGNFRKIVVSGNITFSAPSAAGDYTMVVQITNSSSGGGTFVFNGYTRVDGETILTTANFKYMAFITKVNGFTHVFIQKLQ
jgi:hypothetical protein